MIVPKIPRRNQRPPADAPLAPLAGEGHDATLERLHLQLRKLLSTARQKVQRSINETMVQTCWEMGRLIEEGEQGGDVHSAYGQRTLPALAERLTAEFGKGCATPNLLAYRQFHLGFPNLSTAWRELSWSHYRLLMRVQDPVARKWYAFEAASQGWSVRALQHQINSQYHARLLSSPDKAVTQAEAVAFIAEHAPPHPRDFIRDPHVLEFIGATPGPALHENDVEQGLLDLLQRFLLEQDKGFALVARQRPLRVDDEDRFIDLVFYNYLLKCFVLVDLKLGPPAPQDLQRMDTQVRVFDAQQRQPGDHPTLGLALRLEGQAASAHYGLPVDSEPLFADRCRLYLPGEDELRAELERAGLLIEAARAPQGEA